MTILEHYRSSTEYREILRILQKSSVLQENIFWQSQASSKNIIPIQFMEIDFIAREVVINFDSDNFNIIHDQPFFVKLGYRTSVFKVVSYRLDNHSLSFPFPDVIKTQELRSSHRMAFNENQEKFVVLKSSVGNSPTDFGSELKVRVLDISSSGLGIMISEQNRSFLKNNRLLWITSLQDHHLPRPLMAEVAYMNSEVDSKFHTKKQKTLKVGLKISDPFPDYIYNRLIQ